MPALNYKPEIAAAFQAGTKVHTIRFSRADGKNPRPGQTLYHYTGQRTKRCRKLGETTCRQVRPIQMWIPRSGSLVTIEIDGVRLDARLFDAFARNDGFANMADLCEWFRRSYADRQEPRGLWPFDGLLIQWGETEY